MNVRTLCLAILHDREATGYQIRQLSTAGDYGYFVEASFGAIYPALAKLEQQGFVSCRSETTQGKPAKKIYQITKTGRHELEKTLLGPISGDVVRSEFLLFSRFASLFPAPLVAARLEERIADLDCKISRLEHQLHEDAGADVCWATRHAMRALQAVRTDIDLHKHELVATAHACPDATQEARKTRIPCAH